MRRFFALCFIASFLYAMDQESNPSVKKITELIQALRAQQEKSHDDNTKNSLREKIEKFRAQVLKALGQVSPEEQY